MTILKQVKQTVKNWWLFVILGILLIAAGIYVMTVPVESYITLSIFLSIMVLVNGIFDIIFAISNRQLLKGWGWYLSGGILQVILGYVLMNHPGITMLVLPLILGFWLMFGAVKIISGAFDLKSYSIKGWGWVLALGVLQMLFSFLVIADPIFGSGTIVILTSLAIIFYGLSYVMFGIQLKKVKDFAGDVKKVVSSSLEGLKQEVLAAIAEAKENQTATEDVGKKFDSFKESLS
jgi:uncharacterized membrane protein HdeD (DUF308 family)